MRKLSVTLAALLLSAVCARAQLDENKLERHKLIELSKNLTEKSFDSVVTEAIKSAKPPVRAARGIGSWSDPASYYWVSKDTFMGPFGVRMDRSCMAYEGQIYPTIPDKFVRNLRIMHDTLQKCASERVLPATVGLIYQAATSARVKCDPTACDYDDPTIHAWACTDSDKPVITFREPAHYMDPGTIFHELAHASKHVDNQKTEEHNHHEKYPLRDEVYFWERHCFALPGLVKSMREALDTERDAAKLTRDETDVERLKTVYKTAFEICARPFRYNVRRGLWANEREIQAVCAQYSDFLMMEYNVARTVRRMALEAGECSKVADKDDCPDPAFFEPGTKENLILAKAGLSNPPRGAYSAKDFDAWTNAACALSTPREAVENPAGLLVLRAKRLSERTQDPDHLLTLFSEGVPWEQIFRLQRHFKRLHLKARALMDGPGRYDQALDEAGGQALGAALTDVRKDCAAAEIKDGRFCADLSIDSPLMKTLGALYLHWQPKTL